MAETKEFIKVRVHPKCNICGKYPKVGTTLLVDIDYLGETIYICENCR